MTRSEKLLSEIDAFLAERPMTDYAFGFAAVKNGRLVERLRAGRPLLGDTEDRVRDWMAAQREQDQEELTQ